MDIFLIILIIGGVIIFFNTRNSKRPKFDNKGFTKLEKYLLSEFFNLFDDHISNIIQAQIKYFEPGRKLRQYWEKSMSIELYGDNKNPLSDEFRYNRKDESKLATIQFKVNNENYFIEFDNYNGRIWGWKIRPNPKNIINETFAEIISKKINNDPSVFGQKQFKKKKFKSSPNFNGWINQLIKIDNVKATFHPVDSDYLNKQIKQIDSRLPDKYLELVKQTEGLSFEQFRILGLSEIYTTGLDDGNYYHLAEFDDGILAVKEGEFNGKIYYCHFSGLVDELSADFEIELIKRMKNKTLGIIGIILLVIGLSSIFIDDAVENNFLKKLSEYGRYFSIFGGSFIGIGFFGKKKVKKTSAEL